MKSGAPCAGDVCNYLAQMGDIQNAINWCRICLIKVTVVDKKIHHKMTLTFHGVFFSFTLISLLLQVLGQTGRMVSLKFRNNFPTENHHFALGKCYILFDNKLFWTEAKAECESLISTVAEFKDIKEAYTFISNVYNCPTEYHYFALGKCYIIIVNRLSWTEAKAECESLNSSLAELEDIKEAYSFINDEANFWIGMYDYKPEQSWVWISDNKTVNMSYWNNLSEYLINETCGLLVFYDVPNIHGDYCDSQQYFICMSLPVASTVTTSTTEAPTTTTLSTTEAPTTTSTSTTEAPATTTTASSEEKTSISSQMSTYSSSQISTTSLATTMSTIPNSNSQIGNIPETTTKCTVTVVDKKIHQKMTLTLHGVLFSFTLISLLLQVLGQTDNCPTENQHFALGKCYLLVDNPLPWAEAKAACESLNSSLAELEDTKEAYSFISVNVYWIGVYDYKPEQSWVWISDNKTVNMSYWNDQQEFFSNHRCGFLMNLNVMNIFAGDCSEQAYYICMTLPVASTTTTSRTEAPTTTTPSTTEAPTTTTPSTTEAPTTTTPSTTEAPTTTTTSTNEAPATTATTSSEETTSTSSQMSTYSSSQISTTSPATTMSTVTNTYSQIGNIPETTPKCAGMMVKALPILLSLNLVIFVI
ncbi:cell wall protein DAN4 [Biomphalaria glabrata]|nr:cell wall protein DAN4-like; partial [Biomphalaria glabrata]